MNENQQIPWWVSSTGEGLSVRVKSFLVGALPAVVVIAPLFGFNITEAAGNDLIASVVGTLSAVGTITAGLWHIYGWIRAFVFKKQGLGKFAR